jgi:hypothetical protein
MRAAATRQLPRIRTLALACTVLAVASLPFAAALSYDPWAWLVWGRNIVDLDLRLGRAPSWKPLPVLFTTPLSFTGAAAPALWLVITRGGALFGAALAGRLAARWAPSGWRLLAGCTAAVGLLLVHEYLRRSAVGNVDALMVAFALLAIDRHLDGHRRQALVLAGLAALVRPEIWPFLGIYGIYLWLADRRARPVIVVTALLIPALWLGGGWWGAGNPFQASDTVLVPNRSTPGALTQHHGSRVIQEFADMLPPALFALALFALLLSYRPRSPAWTPVALAAAAVVAWLLMLTVMVERGYTVIPRYLFLPAALVAILGGVGIARIGELTRHRAVVAVVLLAAVALSVDEARLLRSDARTIAAQAVRDRNLGGAVDAAGGADVVFACGAPATEWWEVTALAWQLDVAVPDVRGKVLPAPQVMFAYRDGDVPVFPDSQTVDAGDWQIVAQCRENRAIGADARASARQRLVQRFADPA